MTPLLIRDSSPADLPALVDLFNLVKPEQSITLEQAEFIEQTRDPSLAYGALVAEQDGHVRGRVRFTQLEGASDAYLLALSVEVHPDVQRQGIGTALYDAAWEEMRPHKPTTLMCFVREDQAHALHFATSRGFTEVDRAQIIELPLDQLNTSKREAVYEQARSAGYDLLTFEAYMSQVGETAAWTQRYALEVDASRDIPLPPGDSYEVPPIERFRHISADVPQFDPSLWFVAVKGSEIAAVSQLITAATPSVMDTSGTLVARAHRGQKLAWALKYLALEEAVRRGATSVKTANNLRNLPMRHINVELGFLPLPAYIILQRKLKAETWTIFSTQLGPLLTAGNPPSATYLSGPTLSAVAPHSLAQLQASRYFSSGPSRIFSMSTRRPSASVNSATSPRSILCRSRPVSASPVAYNSQAVVCTSGWQSR